MNGDKRRTAGGSFGAPGDRVTVRGAVHFVWDHDDEGGHTTVNIEADDPLLPNTFELTGDLRAAVLDRLVDGARIEVEYVVEHHEIVDHDGVVTEGHRPRIVDVRVG